MRFCHCTLGNTAACKHCPNNPENIDNTITNIPYIWTDNTGTPNKETQRAIMDAVNHKYLTETTLDELLKDL